MLFLLLALFRATEIYIMFQTKLSEERSSLQTAVNVLTCKLESCHKKLEAREQEIEELRCQTMECCNALEVTHTHARTRTHTHTHTCTHTHTFNGPLSGTIHTHTHPFNGPLSGTTRVSQYQKGKTNLDFTKARDNQWQWHQLATCKSAPSSRQITMPAPHHSVFYRTDALPAAKSTASKH